MAYQNIFSRYEIKYLLNEEQKAAVLQGMQPHMEPDRYGKSTIRNIYYDTQNYRLIRRSLDKPLYKEKLRIRSYRKAESDSTVFVELKKKYNAVVYKRRVPLPQKLALEWLSGQAGPPDSQIGREIAYFLEFYKDLRPTVFLSYQREAYRSREDPDFRVTFDTDIMCRQQELDLGGEIYGTGLLPPGMTLMEIKCAGGIPLWMCRILTQQRIYKASLSKYGTAYEKTILKTQQPEADTNAGYIF